MYGVKDELLADMDCFGTARVLARAIEKIGDVDLVICGEGSGDSYQQQTGNVLGRILGWATLNGINHLEASEDRAFVERSTETDIEEYEVFYPAVLSVTSDINLPRIASFKEIMGAGKKPATIWSLKDVEADVERSVVYDAVEAPQQTERKRLIVEGDDDEAIGQFYNYIKTCI